MNILELLKRLEFADNGRYCKICGFMTHEHTEGYMGGPCPLKAAIDALECGKIQVIHTPNYTSEFIATIEGINENIKRKPKEQGK